MIPFFTFRKKYNGALPDTRTEAERSKDWDARELFVFGAPKFRTVGLGDWARYTSRFQDGSGSCVANSQAKRCEVDHYRKTGTHTQLSHAPVYQKRANKPNAGMGYPDAPKLQVKIHTCSESALPSMGLTDAQLDALTLPANFEEINDTARPNAYVSLPSHFDDVAFHVEQNGGAIIWVWSDYKHWNRGIPTVGGYGGDVRHSICVVDAIRYNSVQYLVIEDSWGDWSKYAAADTELEKLLAARGQRLITREFFTEAVFLAYDLTTFTYEAQAVHFEPFYIPMQYKNKGKEVARLQEYLKAKGLFPTEVASTGYYGNVTAQAVLAFQIRYAVDNLTTLNALKGRYVGAKTLKAINANL